jgi:zinc/manganese transport system substrate-binding protein
MTEFAGRLLAGLLLAAVWALPAAASARAAAPMPVAATFSILGDMVEQIGGERVQVATLVGPDGDPHVFRPTPQHAQAMAGARLVFANGLGFEGWMERLVAASGFKGRLVTVSDGVKPLITSGLRWHERVQAAARGGGHEHGHESEGQQGAPDPHAWHDLANARIYAGNIAAALIEADPEGRAFYEARRDRYLAEIVALEADLRGRLAALPPGEHLVVTGHDAFRYFARAYGINFMAPVGVSTEADASARDIALLIRQIKANQAAAVFMENISDPRLIAQIQRETGAAMGGTLYSGALSGPDGPAPTYLAMMRHNIETLMAALAVQ